MKHLWTRRLPRVALAAMAAAALTTGGAEAKTLVLEGSDAAGVHSHQAGGETYVQQLVAFLREGSALPVALFGSGSLGSALPGTVVSVTAAQLDTLSTSDFSALYIASPGGCCNQNLTGAAAHGAGIGAFYAAGGSVAIQDYQGGDWSFIDPVLVTPPAGTVRGYGAGPGPSCTDGEVFNAEGLAKGFTQPPALGCWEHQAYDNSYFVDTLGFLSLVDADPAYSTAGSPVWTKGGSAFLALGGALGEPGCTDPAGCEPPPTGVPEPGVFALFGLGLAGLTASRRRANAK